jgi:hypothetical protein
MASHFSFHPPAEERIVPWNAVYGYPSQANKAQKFTTRIPPKNGGVFKPSNTFRLEFPAQGYINPMNTTIEFDLTIICDNMHTNERDFDLYFQNNVQSIFNKTRLLYGAQPIEDIQKHNVLVRQLTEWTTSNGAIHDQASIAQGIAGTTWMTHQAMPRLIGSETGPSGVVPTTKGIIGVGAHYTDVETSLVNARTFNHGLIGNQAPATSSWNDSIFQTGVGNATKAYPAGTVEGTKFTATRRYQVQSPLGLFQQGKLIPAKWMASQLAIETTLATPAQCMIHRKSLQMHNPTQDGTLTADGTATFQLSNINLIPEILEFDSSYDAYFLEGLGKGGIPISLSSFHTFTFSHTNSNTANLVIQEKSRSLKAIYAIIRLEDEKIIDDCGATFAGLGNTLDSYQYRIGGNFYPLSPVICSSWETATATHNGAPEAFVELQKCLNTLGDARLSTNVNASSWARPCVTGQPGTPGYPSWQTSLYVPGVSGPTFQNTSDGLLAPFAASIQLNGEYASAIAHGSGMSTGSMSSVFCMATNLETTNGTELSGLNAEELSDISLNIRWSDAPKCVTGGTAAAGTWPTTPLYADASTGTNGIDGVPGTAVLGTVKPNFQIEVFTYYDAILLLRENNVFNLYQ